MPGLVRRGRKRPSPEYPDESSDSDLPTPVTVGSKRARYGRDASDSPAPTNRDRESPHTQNLAKDDIYTDDVFQSGSIVRVKLKNFVTYTAAEFHLGPSLNMIIGPNGTGKSTLVCAICLGLGWSSEHLGRAKELSAFVKHGAAEAEIEIELTKGEGMRTNPVVTRILRREDNKTVFLLNGKHSTKNAVMELCKSFAIQIDNLCQFLPQDRVVEFAKMKDTERLRATLGAAARPEMSLWHDQLKSLREEEKDLEVKRHNDEDHLKRLQALQNTTRSDVEIWNQRQELAAKAKALEKVRPIIELRLRKEEYQQVKDDLQAARRELDQLNMEVEPVKQAGAVAQNYHNQVNQIVQRRKQMMDMVKKQAEKKAQAIKNENQVVEGFQGQISGEIRSQKARKQDINRIEKKIADLERKQQEQSVDYDPETYQHRKDELRQEISAIERRTTELRGNMAAMQPQVQDLKDQIRGTEQQRAALDTQSGKQSNLLHRISPETAEAWEWFKKNKATLPLKGDVYGPPILSCSITEPKYADAVESQLRIGDVLAITCAHPDDQGLLLNRIGKHGIYLRTSPRPLSSYPRPVAGSSLHEYGFEGYLIDYIKGPDPVVAMLCDNQKLNRVAFASQAISDEQHAAAQSSPIQSWVSGREAYRITTRREYGVSSTAVTQLRKGQWFVDQPVNSEEKTQLDQKLQDLKRDAMEKVEEHNQAKAEINELTEQSRVVKERREEVVQEETNMKRAVAQWEAIPRIISQNKSELQGYIDSNAQTSTRVRELKAQLQLSSLKIANLTLEYAKLVTEFRRFHETLVEAEIRLIEAASEVRALEKENRLILERLRSRQVQVTQLENACSRMKKEIREFHHSMQASIDDLPAEDRDVIASYKDLATVAELEDEIQSVNARLDMMSAGNPQAVKTFETREQQIRKTQDSLEKHIANLAEAQDKIKEIRGPWEKELDELIVKISDAFAHNFAQIGCAGEVAVYKDEEDFNSWSIQISVRFREGESMSILNANRQSGGERAVSTIFYLMALQDLAQAPFRVVDEINQGMDPRNERMVHERMVDIACQERTSQYFLITPKLLSGLKFHPKMKVHIINSGEHIPKSTTNKDEWNVKDMAKIALAVRGHVSAAA